MILPVMRISAQGIIQAEIYPEVISHDDSVFLLVDTWFPYNDCKLDSAVINYGCGAVSVSAFYSTWFEEDSCSRRDTFALGTFVNGYYALDFNMLYPDWVTADEYQGNFTVGLTAAGEKRAVISKSLIYPNPSKGKISLREESKSLVITNMQGQILRSSHNISKEQEIDLHLPPGLYIFRQHTEHSNRTGKLLIQ